MNKILEKLMAVLPLVEAGDTEVIELAQSLKEVLQGAQLWTEAHETVFQTAVTGNPVTPSVDPNVGATVEKVPVEQTSTPTATISESKNG